MMVEHDVYSDGEGGQGHGPACARLSSCLLASGSLRRILENLSNRSFRWGKVSFLREVL